VRSIFLLLGISLIFCLGNQCQSNRSDGKIILGLEDIPCGQVWDKIINSLGEKNIPIHQANPQTGIILAGPVMTTPLPGSSFQKTEESYRIVLKCFEPLSSQVTCQIKLRGLRSAGEWIEVKDVTGYENRFLKYLFPTNRPQN
jgi:hypothetical protein